MALRTFAVVWIAVFGLACSQETLARRHFERGQAYLAAKQLSEAIIEFRNAVDRDERWGDARLKLADAYAAAGEPEQAFRHYVRAADLLPDNPQAQLTAITYLLAAGQYQDARSRAVRVLDKAPANVDAQIALGNALAGLRDFSGAVAALSRAIDQDAGRSEAYTSLGRVHVAQWHTDEARAAFEQATKAAPNSISAHLALADFYWSVSEVDRAEASLGRALLLDANDLLTNRTLAKLYLATNRPAEAERHLKVVAERSTDPESQVSLADLYISSRRFEDARRVLLPMTTRERSRSAAETRLASIAYSQGASTEAHRMLDALLAREPNNADALVVKAQWLLGEGKPQDAWESANNALAASPSRVDAHSIKVDAETALHRPGDAVKSLLNILKLEPGNVDAQVRLSSLYLARGEIAAAMHTADEALTEHPERLDARLALVRAHIAGGDYKLVEPELALLKRQAPASANVLVAEGTLRMRRGDQRAARDAFERALRLDPKSREAFIGLTTLDVLQHHVTQALTRTEFRVSIAANDPELLLVAAKVFVVAGDLPRAEELLRRSIALDPRGINNFALLASVLTKRQMVDAAITAFDETARSQPGNIAARLMSAILLHAQGKLAEATSRYEEILKADPRAALAANNLAALYADRGDNLLYAQRLAESASAEQPTHAGVRDTLGWVYLSRKLYGPAINEFSKSVAAEPSNSLYQYHLGLAYIKSGETDHARTALQTAIKLNPGLSDAKRALKALGA